MKTKKLNKKLSLSKITVANLGIKEQSAVNGGYHETAMFGTCPSWHPICYSKPDHICPYSKDNYLCPHEISEEIC